MPQQLYFRKIADFLVRLLRNPLGLKNHKPLAIKLLQLLNLSHFEVSDMSNIPRLLIASADSDLSAQIINLFQKKLTSHKKDDGQRLCLTVFSYCYPYAKYLIDNCDGDIGNLLKKFSFEDENSREIGEEDVIRLLDETLSTSFGDLKAKYRQIEEITLEDWKRLQSSTPKSWNEVIERLLPEFKIEAVTWVNYAELKKISELSFVLESEGMAKRMIPHSFYQKALLAFIATRKLMKDHQNLLESKFPVVRRLPLTPTFVEVVRETVNSLFQQTEPKVYQVKFLHLILSHICQSIEYFDVTRKYDKPIENEEHYEINHLIESLMVSQSSEKPQKSLLYDILDLSWTLMLKRNSSKVEASSHGCPMLFMGEFEEKNDLYFSLMVDASGLISEVEHSYALSSRLDPSTKLIPGSLIFPNEAKALAKLIGNIIYNVDFGKNYLCKRALSQLGESMNFFLYSYDYISTFQIGKAIENLNQLILALLDEKILSAIECDPRKELTISKMYDILLGLGRRVYKFPKILNKAKENDQMNLIGDTSGWKLFTFDYQILLNNPANDKFPYAFQQIARIPFIFGLMGYKRWIKSGPKEPELQPQRFFEAFDKFYLQYKPTGAFLELTFISRCFQGNEKDAQLFKHISQINLFEKIPDIFWTSFNRPSKIKRMHEGFIAHYESLLLQKQENSRPLLNTIRKKLVTIHVKNCEDKFNYLEQLMLQSASEEEILKEFGRIDDLSSQWNLQLKVIRETQENSDSSVQSYHQQIVHIARYPTILLLQRYGRSITEYLQKIHKMTDWHEMREALFDNLINIYERVWGVIDLQQPLTEDEVLKIPLLNNCEWLTLFVVRFKDNDQHSFRIDWKVGLTMDLTSLRLILYVFNFIQVFTFAWKVGKHLEMKSTLRNYANVKKLIFILRSTPVILKCIIQRYIELNLSAEGAFSVDKAAESYERIAHSMVGKSRESSLLKQVGMGYLFGSLLHSNDTFLQESIVSLFSHFELCEIKDFQNNPKEASRQIWNALLFDFLLDIKDDRKFIEKIDSRMGIIDDTIFNSQVIVQFTSWIFNTMNMSYLHTCFKEMSHEIHTKVVRIMRDLGKDPYAQLTREKFEETYQSFADCIIKLSVYLNQKDIMIRFNAKNFEIIMEFMVLLLTRIKRFQAAEGIE